MYIYKTGEAKRSEENPTEGDDEYSEKVAKTQ